MTASGPDLDREAAQTAITRGIAFLAAEQDANGEIPVYTSTRGDPGNTLTRDPSIFPTALAAQALANIPAAAAICEKAFGFLLNERRGPGLWSHFPHDHRGSGWLPPDIDDTCCVSQALHAAGRAGGAPPDLLMANRAPGGLFYTWIVPRLRSLSPFRLGLTFRHTIWPLRQFVLSDKAIAKPGDIDAVVNANALHYLGRFDGHEAIVAHLSDILRAGSERNCDKWYDNPFVVRYFFARALLRVGSPATQLIAERAAACDPETALDHALQISTLRSVGLGVPASTVAALLDAQGDDGSWLRAPLYNGGRQRRRGGGFAPPASHMRCWGSQALTTAFALEALQHWAQGEGKSAISR